MWITRGVGALRTRALPIAVVLVAVAGALSVFRAEALLPVAGPDGSGTGLVTQLPPDASVAPSPAVQQCTAPDNGSGTVTLPVLGCEYSAADEVLQIIDGLPPGTTIELDPILMDFLCSDPAICSLPLDPGQCETAGGSLGGHGCCADATLDLTVSGTGDLTGFNRHLAVPVALEAHSGPRTPGDPVQTFPRDMYRLFGELFGDPDFCEFRITAGTDYGLPGPGQTTLTQLPGGDFAVDSFFDLTYQIEFEGCPGSQLDGYMGTTTATIRIATGDASEEIKWWQLPDLAPTGLDVTAQIPGSNVTLADDFQCTTTGPITQIDVWGSWYDDYLPLGDPEAVSFTLSIHADVPAGGEPLWSHPGELLWSYTFAPGECVASLYETELEEGWFDPPGYYEPLADTQVWLYRCAIPEESQFYQEQGTVYWLDVAAYPEEESYFGWKTSLDHWNDDGVWAQGEDPDIDPSDWSELRYPLGHPMEGESIDLAFRIWGSEAPAVATQKWQQEPDLASTGMDVSAQIPGVGVTLADDFECTTTGPITEIHVWGSWLEDYLPSGDPEAVSFTLSIHEDVPAGGGEPSHPGDVLWLWDSPEFRVNLYQSGLEEGWLDPPADYTPLADTQVWEYIFDLDPAQYCTAPDNGGGTADLPADCDYVADDPMKIIDGLPPGTTIEMDAVLMDFTCASPPCETPGGPLGGTVSDVDATLDLTVSGTGDLAGFNRHLAVPVSSEFHWGSRTPGDPVQTFEGDVYRLSGELFGDPDFCEFIVTAGRDYGLPGPGQTTLADKAGAFAVDSFFDITYQIEFEGCPASQLDGYMGTTTGMTTIRYGPPSFIQQGTEDAPIVYWLDVAAYPEEESYFGWKTSLDHWNDDGTWAATEEPVDPSAWSELRYPVGHPMEGESIDLAFEVWGREEPVPEETAKWRQEPDAAPTGMDVSANAPEFVLADDYQCTVTGPITEIVVWGSWLDDDLPAEGADDVSFTLSIHEDVPAAGGEPSHPGDLLWRWDSPQFTVDPYQGGVEEGWLEPPADYTPAADSIIWEYSFNVDPAGYCTASDNGTGTVDLPVADCGYVAPGDPLKIIDGLPTGTTIELAPTFDAFSCDGLTPCSLTLPPGECEGTGGSLGGTFSCVDGTLDLVVTGTGSLAGFNRHLSVPVSSEFHWGSRTPGEATQTFSGNLYRLSGELFGDPDFCEFIVTAGTDYGLPGPGQTTLTELPSGDFAVNSFFDVTYQIEFEGCPGSPLDDYAGTTTDTTTIRYGPPTFIQQGTEEAPVIYWLDVQTDSDEGLFGWKTSLDHWNDDGAWAPGTEPVGPLCRAPDDGTGTVELPIRADDCEYTSLYEVLQIIDGLPPGTTIELDPILMDFLCSDPAICSLPLGSGECETAGGSLGGHGCCAEATLDLTVSGTGDLTGFNRHLAVPVALEAHSGPRTPGDPVQTFPRDMYRLFGELFGDPDFCEFRITAGTDYGLPGPGQTTLTKEPIGDFTVDSFFDLTYQIEFEGCPGSVLDGYMGTTTGTIRIEIPDEATEWSELLYPPGHPLVGQSIDLAFAVSGRAGAPCTDREGDTQCDEPSTDPDDDGCTTAEETALGDNFDGDAWYDVYDVPVPAKADASGANGSRNKVIDIGDVLAVLFYAFADDNGGPNANGVDYDSIKGWDGDGDSVNDADPIHDIEEGQKYDRSPGLGPSGDTGKDPAGAPNGSIDIGDVLAVLAQAFVVDCSGES